jgi:hypothetical protein
MPVHPPDLLGWLVRVAAELAIIEREPQKRVWVCLEGNLDDALLGDVLGYLPDIVGREPSGGVLLQL